MFSHKAVLGQVHHISSQICLLLLLFSCGAGVKAAAGRVASTHRLTQAAQNAGLLVLLHAQHVLKVLLVVQLNILNLKVAAGTSRPTLGRVVELGCDGVEVARLLVLLGELLGLMEAGDPRLLQHGPTLMAHAKLPPRQHKGKQHQREADQGGDAGNDRGYVGRQSTGAVIAAGSGQCHSCHIVQEQRKHAALPLLHEQGKVGEMVALAAAVRRIRPHQAAAGIRPGQRCVVPEDTHRTANVGANSQVFQRYLNRVG